MKITVPLNYQVAFKEPKKIAWQKEYLITDHTLDIREVSVEDTEVAFRLAELPSGDDRWVHVDSTKAFRTNTGEACNVRAVDGKFYIERFPATELQARFSAEPTGDKHDTESRSPIEGIVKMPPRVDDHGGYSYERVGFHHKTGNRSQADLSAEKGFELKRFTSYEAESREVANQLAQNFIIVGDMVLERVAEPKLRVIAEDGTVVIIIDELPHDITRAKNSQNRGNYGRNYTFGIDEYDRACAFAEQCAEEQGKPFVKLAVVEAVSPWDVTFRGENETLYQVAREAYRHICQSSSDYSHTRSPSLMATMTRQGAVAAYDLAMAVEQHAETSPALVSAVRHIVTLAERLEPTQWFDAEAVMEARSYYRGDDTSSEIFRQEKERLVAEQAARLKGDLVGLRRALQCFDTKSVGKLDWTEKMLDVKPTFRDHYRYVEVTNFHRANLLSDQMDTDLTGAASDAALGRGHLFVIEDFQADRAVGAVYVSNTLDPADEPYVFKANGNVFEKAHADTILAMVRTAAPVKNTLVEELDDLTL
jgi:hypothetical protein